MTAKERFASYKELAKVANSKRTNLSPLAFELNKGTSVEKPEVQEGDWLVIYADVAQMATARASELVFGDETSGKVFPGGMLWAESLRDDGRLDQVLRLNRQSKLIVSVDPATAKMKANTPVNYSYDGSFPGFSESLAEIISNIATATPKIFTKITTIEDTKAALLNLGISAKGWGASLSATLDTRRKSSRSVLLASLDQAYFTLVCSPPNGQFYFEEAMFEDEGTAEILLQQVAQNGEIGVVSKVTYGRRILLSFVSNASSESLRATLNAGFHAANAGADGHLTVEQTETLKQTECQLVVIGGKSDPVFTSGAFLPANIVMENLRAFLAHTDSFDELTSAAVMSFEVQYAYDLATLIKADSVNFTEQVRVSQRLASKSLSVPALVYESGGSATIKKGDGEIDSDDWTYTRVAYWLSVSEDGRSIIFEIDYDAREGNDNKTFGDTWLQLSEKREIYRLDSSEKRNIRSILSKQTDEKDKWHQGERHGFQEFPSFGALSVVQVRFDAEGKNDQNQMKLTCKIDLNLDLGPGPKES